MVGRDEGCDVRIDDPSVSRRHVALERRGGGWFVVDQGSVNGSFLDGKRVGEGPLRDGQRLRLGSVELRVQIEPEDDATVLMKTPEEAPPVTNVEVRGPAPAPPAAAPSLPPARPRPRAAPVAPAARRVRSHPHPHPHRRRPSRRPSRRMPGRCSGWKPAPRPTR